MQRAMLPVGDGAACGVEAMLTGAVFSTRAISTSAGRGSPFGRKPARIGSVGLGLPRNSRGIGEQLMVNDLGVEKHFDRACSSRF